MHTTAPAGDGRVTHVHERAFAAARSVDPLLMAQALDHIAHTAARSRSQTRRLRWIEQRALIALAGREYRDIDVDLPKSAGPNTAERLKNRMDYHAALKHELAGLLREVIASGAAVAPDLAARCAKTLAKVEESTTEEGDRA